LICHGLDDYFPFLFPDGRGFVVVIAAYFDESEREDGEQPICVGGFLFKPSGYKALRRYWQSNVLRFRGRQVAPFHMTDLCAGKGVYDGLTIDERLVILNHAVEAVKRNACAAQGVFFDQQELIRKVPAEWPHAFGSIYTIACHMCLQVTGFWLREWSITMPVLYTFERGHRFQSEANAFMDAIGNNEELARHFMYRNHVFESKTEVGLQAADMYAWTITKARSIHGGPIPRAMQAFTAPLLRMVEGSDGRYRIMVLQGEMLDRFIDESLTRTIALVARRSPSVPTFT
jgi:hypothetical protein